MLRAARCSRRERVNRNAAFAQTMEIAAPGWTGRAEPGSLALGIDGAHLARRQLSKP